MNAAEFRQARMSAEAARASRFLIPSDPQAVRRTLAGVLAALKHHELSGNEVETLELVLAEAMNNVVEHAYRDDRGVIELTVDVNDETIDCRIRDAGYTMDEGAPEGGLPEMDTLLPQDLPEGGFGWHLIRTLTIALDYRSTGQGNCLNFSIPRAEPAPSD